jgi:hypothetical protein
VVPRKFPSRPLKNSIHRTNTIMFALDFVRETALSYSDTASVPLLARANSIAPVRRPGS